jgi:hypothetical protein
VLNPAVFNYFFLLLEVTQLAILETSIQLVHFLEVGLKGIHKKKKEKKKKLFALALIDVFIFFLLPATVYTSMSSLVGLG